MGCPPLLKVAHPSFVGKLRGIYALAIYDTRLRRLLLSRDRFGIKPLFYAPGRDRLAFASEIRALLELPDIERRPDRQAMYDFTALFYMPAPETFYRGIRALQPDEILGAQLDLNGGSWKTRAFQRWAITPDSDTRLAQAVDRADTLITEGVHRRMESDVPLDALLSVGMNSSLISTAAQHAIGGIRTFNVHFPEKE